MKRLIHHLGVAMRCEALRRPGGYVGMATIEGAIYYVPDVTRACTTPLHPTPGLALAAAERAGAQAIERGTYRRRAPAR